MLSQGAQEGQLSILAQFQAVNPFLDHVEARDTQSQTGEVFCKVLQYYRQTSTSCDSW